MMQVSNECIFHSNLIKTDVTAVKILQCDRLLVGIGGTASLYQLSNQKFIGKKEVFIGQKIYGFVPNPQNELEVAVYGGKLMKICLIETSSVNNIDIVQSIKYFDGQFSFKCDDWILSLVWKRTHDIAVLTAHNVIQVWSPTLNEKTNVYKCDEKCILYSGCLTELDDSILVMGGTVFSQVVLWNSQNSRVQQRIIGHKGVIFSVFYSSEKNIIITTSDDRSVRIWSLTNTTGEDSKKSNYWSNVQIESLATLFGHTARVMRGTIVGDSILSIGEDGLMCLWRLNGDLIKKKKIHQGGCLWAMDSDTDKRIAITGGSDSGVSIHRIENSIPKIISLSNMPGKYVCKKVVITACGNIVCYTEHGVVFYYDTKSELWHLKHQITFSQSCHIMSISLCRSFVSFAGVNGNLTIMAESENNLEVVSDTIIDGKILSLHWIDDRCIVLCCENGSVTLWRYLNEVLTQFEEYCLPPSKERWLTVAVVEPSSKQFHIIGDRCGNIYLFKAGFKHPMQSLPKVHGRLGVNDIHFGKEYVMTTGRDGSVKYFHLSVPNEEKPKLEYYHNIKVPFDWVEKFIDNDDQILCGFHETNLVVWNMTKHTCILDINCGGGHRSWDLARHRSTCNGEKLDTLRFAFIKNFNVHVLTENFHENDCHIIEEGFHVKEINDLRSIEYLADNVKYSIIISAGEDTAIRISLARSSRTGDEFTFNELYKITKHSSSIRCLSLQNIHTKNSLIKESILFTGGGRAQICVWKLSIALVEKKPFVRLKEISNYMLKGTDLERKKNNAASNNIDMTGETRFMSLHCASDEFGHLGNNTALDGYINLILFAGCSDGVLRIYSLSYRDEINSSLTLIKAINHHEKCILKVFSFVFEKKGILLSMSVDGMLKFWDLKQIFTDNNEHIKPFHQMKIHKAGINSFDMTVLGDKIVLATGGDDNCLCLNVFSILFDELIRQLRVENICQWQNSTTHCAQVTGVKLIKNYLITTSIDQRLTVFQWKYDKNIQDTLECKHIGQYHSSISDVQGMDIVSNNRNNLSVFIFGKGVEVLSLELALENNLHLL